jgi:hypothetical protein
MGGLEIGGRVVAPDGNNVGATAVREGERLDVGEEQAGQLGCGRGQANDDDVFVLEWIGSGALYQYAMYWLRWYPCYTYDRYCCECIRMPLNLSEPS